MATAVLRPHHPAAPIDIIPRSKPKAVRRRRTPSDEKRSVKSEKELVMEKVRILKRGDKLSPDLSVGEKKRTDRCRSVTFEKVEAVVLCSTDRLGPDPVVVKEEVSLCEEKMKKTVVVVEDKFAGCVVVASPPPSSVPMPKKFLMKKESCVDAVDMAVDLRRLLRLDLI